MYEVNEKSGFEDGESFDGWTCTYVSGGSGWGIGHVFRGKASAELAAKQLNDLILIERQVRADAKAGR